MSEPDPPGWLWPGPSSNRSAQADVQDTFPVAPSRYSERIYDTMSKWAGFGNRIKLDTLARALGVGGKEGMDGSQVYDY